jgi:TRAP-type C4-dicarboxylate transport system substrate-binding protein
MWLRLALALLVGAAFLFGLRQLERFPIQVVGQPSVTGPIQRELEQPFFANLASETGVPLDVTYGANDQLGLKDTFQLLMLRNGALDLVSLRFLQNAPVEPMLLGLDLPGAASDFATARAIVDAYAPRVDRALATHHGSKLLGAWPFGPQIFFCRKEVRTLQDLSGLRIRVGSDNFASLIASLGGKPAVITFEDVATALRDGLIDCAITSATSGNAAGWPKYTTHLFELGTQLGINGYVVSLRLWEQLSKAQQGRLEAAFARHVEAIWATAQELHEQAVSCSTGGPCTRGTPYALVRVAPSPDDVRRLRDGFERTSYADWVARCDRVHATCSNDWLAAVSPALAARGVALRFVGAP